MKLLKVLTIVTTLVLVGCQCGSSPTRGDGQSPPLNREQQIQNQRDFLAKERESIESYIKDRGLDMQRTGTGLYYKITKDSISGGNAETGDIVLLEYTISLLNGTRLYSSAESGKRNLRIDKQDAEIGLHEALKQLGLGDEGLFILPSHLAFGVAGDQKRVPPVTALVYEIKLVQIEKSKS